MCFLLELPPFSLQCMRAGGSMNGGESEVNRNYRESGNP